MDYVAAGSMTAAVLVALGGFTTALGVLVKIVQRQSAETVKTLEDRISQLQTKDMIAQQTIRSLEDDNDRLRARLAAVGTAP
jgi:cell division protein FtsB